MNAIDLVFLAVGVGALTLWLVLDKVARAIVWDSLRHPFTRSRIEVKDGKVRVVHLHGEATRKEVCDKP